MNKHMLRLVTLLLPVFAASAQSTAAHRGDADLRRSQDTELVGSYYNGGFGGNGTGPGPAYGITFGSDSLALISDSAGGGGRFSGNPSGSTVVFFESGPGVIMDVSGRLHHRLLVLLCGHSAGHRYGL